MLFEVMGSKQEFSLFCSGRSEVPKVNGDNRMVFMKRVKSMTPGAPLPIKKFVLNDNCFSFGPLLVFKQAEWRSEPAIDAAADVVKRYDLVKNTNCEIFRLTNIGSYKCQVDLGLLNIEPPVVFHIEQPVFSLEEGETKEVKVWSFPPSATTFKNSIIGCISNNPEPLRFDMICSGVTPSLELSGPWEEAKAAALAAAEAAVTECKDPKQLKDLEAKRDVLRNGGITINLFAVSI